MAAVGRTRNAPGSFRFDGLNQLSDKGNRIGVERTANLKRFNKVDSPLS
jgi:hypothetical protein